ncbi:MAG: methyltransferase domain-containing protein [Candidatus ainarchaeum sp.]|nr:methyltransferase domain-containing protein [Candidatus ainarchaeum sp.]MDD5095906.1 methyltransferase domain-containing protein [Candidatus ainarchaeum sp.]
MKNLEVRVPHMLRRLKRGPSVMLPKDIGMIIAYTCLGKDSLVVDAGAGTGFNAIMLGRIAKKVVSYERREEFAKLAAENVKSLGMKNVRVRNTDIMNGIEEKDIDLVTLDMPESEKVVPLAHAALKAGGHCVGYLPNIEQAKEFYMEAQKSFREVFMLENMVREYEVRDFGVRPKHVGLMHTAYLVFARK